jgi:hypothetical protein
MVLAARYPLEDEGVVALDYARCWLVVLSRQHRRGEPSTLKTTAMPSLPPTEWVRVTLSRGCSSSNTLERSAGYH